MFDDDVDSEDFDTVVTEMIKSGVASMHVGSVAVVVAYDATQQRCSCKPVVRGGIKGSTQGVEWPVLTNVPVRFPAGGDFSVTYPIKEGDFVWLDFGDRSIDDWLNSGQSDVTPQSKRRFHISDAVAYPGTRPFSKPLANASSTEMVIGQDEYDGTITNDFGIAAPLRMRFGPAGLRIGDLSSSFDLLNILADTITVVKTGMDTGGFVMNPAAVALLTAIEVRLNALREP